jgi:primosomal protein N'
MRKFPRIGDRVTIPFGRGRVEGMVIDAYTSIEDMVTIEVLFYGSDESTTISWPLKDVEPVGAKAA